MAAHLFSAKEPYFHMTFPCQLLLANWWESQHNSAVESEQELDRFSVYILMLTIKNFYYMYIE